MKTKYFFLLVLLVLLVFYPEMVEAQCPMCKMGAESNLNNGGSSGKGLNNGILYMLATPYLIIGAIAYVWWRNRKKKGEEIELVEECMTAECNKKLDPDSFLEFHRLSLAFLVFSLVFSSISPPNQDPGKTICVSYPKC